MGDAALSGGGMKSARERTKRMPIAEAIQIMTGISLLRYDRLRLEQYGRNLAGRVHRHALPYVESLQKFRDGRIGGKEDLLHFMGDRHGTHALYATDLPWLNLFETQICSAFAHFIRAEPGEGLGRGLAFLRALAGHLPWPEPCDDSVLRVRTEYPNKDDVDLKGPRIDILIDYLVRGVRYRLVVEVKIRNKSVFNPLNVYTKLAAEEGLRAENTAFVVLVPSLRRQLHRRMRSHWNRHWRVVEWKEFLRRLERSISHDDPHFRQFRRLVWKAIDV
jgi:hypothetical protein